MGDCVVDVADESQRQVIISRVDPSRARQSATQGRQRLSDIGRNFDSGKKARHCETLRSRCASGARSVYQLFHRRQNALHNRINAGDIRMQTVHLI